MAARRRATPNRTVTPPSYPEPYPVFSGATATPAGVLSRRERIGEIAAILARGALRHLARLRSAGADAQSAPS